MSTASSSNSAAQHSSVRNEFKSQFGNKVRFDEKLAPHLAYKIGGPADILAFPETEEDLNSLSLLAKKHQLPITIVGTGTNLLVRDEGIRGITISLSKAFREIEKITPDSSASPDALWVRCGGGVSKPELLEWAIELGLSGLEFSAGVPGTIGGGIYMNAGTKYGCYGDILKELRLFDFKNGGRSLRREDVHFGYREQNAVGESLVVWATFELRPGDKSAIRKEVNRIIEERAEKQPLDFPSCGSTFKNPEGYSAGRLIEKAGLKGTCVGGAEISLKHANFILNKGNATARDILTLIDIIKARVKEQFGVTLECEVIVLGGSSDENKVSHKN
jgi:UDP-N-acetylmuramate dehydrogenase